MSAVDRDTLAALLAEHHYAPWGRCGCGWFDELWEDGDSQGRHATHLADVLLASDWLREQRAEAWKAGHHAGRHDAVMLYSGHLDDSHTPNPYRTMEGSDG